MTDGPRPEPPTGEGAPAGRPEPSPDRVETAAQRADRNFVELLQELRVSQTGVQFLFAFLLILAYQPTFADADAFVRATYVVTILLCAVAAVLLIAPVAVHRALFARRRKPEVVAVSARYAEFGLGFLGAGVVGALLLALDAVVARWAAIALAVAFAGLVTWAWLLQPRLLARQEEPPAAPR